VVVWLGLVLLLLLLLLLTKAAQVGLCRPGDMGADVCHLNLHKVRLILVPLLLMLLLLETL